MSMGVLVAPEPKDMFLAPMVVQAPRYSQCAKDQSKLILNFRSRIHSLAQRTCSKRLSKRRSFSEKRHLKARIVGAKTKYWIQLAPS